MKFYSPVPLILTALIALHSVSCFAYTSENIVVVTNQKNDVEVLDKKGLINLVEQLIRQKEAFIANYKYSL